MLKHVGPLVQIDPVWNDSVQFEFGLVAFKLVKRTTLSRANMGFTASVNTLLVCIVSGLCISLKDCNTIV